MKIGVVADCFKSSLEDSLKNAASLGLEGVQVYATGGGFSPDELTQTKKAGFKKILYEYGLTLSALCGDLGGHGFEIASDNVWKIALTKKIIRLAEELECRVVTTHIGVIPDAPDTYKYRVMLSALDYLGSFAKKHGVTLAIETGPESAATLKGFLDRTHGGVGVNLDPANFVMVTGQDPVEAVHLLKDYIVHTHAKDGIMLKKTSPRIIYDHFADGGIEALNTADYFRETVLGEGKVDFDAYLQALRDIGYDGFLTIERETGKNPYADIELAAEFLRKKLSGK
jgi:sugar phosphate isomerase/epimerase